MLGDIVAGVVFKKLGRFRIQLVFSAAALTVFIGLMASTTQHTVARAIVVSEQSVLWIRCDGKTLL